MPTEQLGGSGCISLRDKAEITVLYDAFGKPSAMKKDWGYAALIEYRGKRILFDTGNNAEIFANNVKAKGVDLTTLDFVVVSHRHGDHTSGLDQLLSVNPDVTIYAPQENFGVFGAALPGNFYKRNEALPADTRYFDGDPPETLRFGSAWPEANFTWVTKDTEIAPGFHLIVLLGSWGVDLEVKEISLAIETPDGIVLIVGCGHPKIETIVKAAKAALNKPINLVIGGLHLLPASDNEIRRIATALCDTWNVRFVAPGPCTGEPGFAILKEVFSDRYIYAGLGSNLRLGPTVTSRPRRDSRKRLQWTPPIFRVIASRWLKDPCERCLAAASNYSLVNSGVLNVGRWHICDIHAARFDV